MLFVMLIRNVKIELITNFPCDREYNLTCKQTEIVNKLINDIEMNINSIFIILENADKIHTN